VRPSPLRWAFLGLAMGVVLEVIFVFGWEALDRKWRSSEEVERTTGVRALIASEASRTAKAKRGRDASG